MNKLVLLPVTLPLAIARGAVKGALGAVVDAVEDVVRPERDEGPPTEAPPAAPRAPRTRPVVPVEPLEPELGLAEDMADLEAALAPEPEPGPGVAAEPEPEPEPESPADVAEALDLPTEEPTRGEVAQLREEQREAEATPDSPGAQIRVDEPWNGYRSMAAADIVDRLAVADDATKAQVRLYESTHRRRKTVLEATEQ